MLNGKTDLEYGELIEDWLNENGCGTPTSKSQHEYIKSDVDYVKIEKLTKLFKKVMDVLDLDCNDDSLKETPKRMAEMYVKEIFGGLRVDQFPKATTVENKMGYNDLIVEKVSIKSVCEHHFVYFGTAHSNNDLGCWIAYIPRDKVVGLSKLSRIAEYFSRRPQIQERLTKQIALALQYILDTEDVAVVIRAQHFCVLTRGVEDADSHTTTSHLGGVFMNEPSLRAELMSIVNKG